ncbi:MAG: glutamate-1-semialdehyde 2,1-aminomutase [Lentisphaeria bacterium]|nr:glutamate-1-semialdehyde 2,1-aminomutase [Lentisphaeria bacterium]
MTSAELFDRGSRVIPGGVNSPVRAFNSVGGTPVYMASGKGSRLTTVEGRELIDFCGSWGPLILGHAREEVVEAATEATARGMSFGANTVAEVEFAELLCSRIPHAEKVRLVSSGTEATMTALRLARGVTGRTKILKFNGGYHGHSDGLLVAAGSGLLTGGVSSSAGVTDTVAADVFIPQYNDLEAVDAIVAESGGDLAAVIVEPIAGNMGVVPPAPGFLEGLRTACTRCGALLIFDEVITGFRMGPTTYGNIAGVTPDLTCLGKIIGGGMPIGGIVGPDAIMEQLAPNGAVYQAGTLSGNPVAVAAGMKTLEILIREHPYPRLTALGADIATGVNEAARRHGVAMHCAAFGGSFTCFFRRDPVRNLEQAKDCDTKAFAAFYHAMLAGGIYLPPSQFETAFVSAAHSNADIGVFLEVVDSALAQQRRNSE